MPCTVFGSTFALLTSQLLSECRRLWRPNRWPVLDHDPRCFRCRTQIVGDKHRSGKGPFPSLQRRKDEIRILGIVGCADATRAGARPGEDAAGTWPSDASVLVWPSLRLPIALTRESFPRPTDVIPAQRQNLRRTKRRRRAGKHQREMQGCCRGLRMANVWAGRQDDSPVVGF